MLTVFDARLVFAVNVFLAVFHSPKSNFNEVIDALEVAAVKPAKDRVCFSAICEIFRLCSNGSTLNVPVSSMDTAVFDDVVTSPVFPSIALRFLSSVDRSPFSWPSADTETVLSSIRFWITLLL